MCPQWALYLQYLLSCGYKLLLLCWWLMCDSMLAQKQPDEVVGEYFPCTRRSWSMVVICPIVCKLHPVAVERKYFWMAKVAAAVNTEAPSARVDRLVITPVDGNCVHRIGKSLVRDWRIRFSTDTFSSSSTRRIILAGEPYARWRAGISWAESVISQLWILVSVRREISSSINLKRKQENRAWQEGTSCVPVKVDIDRKSLSSWAFKRWQATVAPGPYIPSWPNCWHLSCIRPRYSLLPR